MKVKIFKLVIPALFYGCAQYPMDGSRTGWGHMMGGGYGGIFMWLILIIIAGIIIYFAVNRSKNAGDPGGSANESAIEILKRRYARGEVSREEFIRIKKELES